MASTPPDRPVARTRSVSDAAVQALATPPMASALGLAGYRCVMALRVLALCSQAGRDPLLELGHRLRNISAAREFLAFADRAGMVWPGKVSVFRPCCIALSPDEWTLGALADAAARGDREGFSRWLEGLVRPGRHEPLYDLAVRAVAAMQGD